MRMDQDLNGLLCFARCEHTGYPPVIVRLKSVGALEENCRHRPVQYLNSECLARGGLNPRIVASGRERRLWVS
jgi:hypothetical protein